MSDRLEEIRRDVEGLTDYQIHAAIPTACMTKGDALWLLDEVVRLRAELNPEAMSLEDVIGDDAERIRRLRDAHQELNKALHELVVAYPVAARLDRQVEAVVSAQRRINEIHAEES